jgi:putative PIN family toxin of toxin-antitoxin system
MIKIVLDTNVVVSALLKADSTPELIVSMIREKQMLLCLSKGIFEEYSEVLSRDKFKGLNRKKVRELLSELKKDAIWVDPHTSVDVVKADPTDNKFLECALKARADFLITGNTRHFSFNKFHGIRITTPSDFLHIVAKMLFE